MGTDSGILKPEDYVEPRCVLCEEPYGAEKQVRSIPQRRVIEKMDDYMSRRDYDGAERHLLYWLEEARLGGDLRGELLVRNELVGHYRKVSNKEAAFEHAEKALRLLEELEFDGTISSGTTYTNVATACNAFGENERSLELFEKAREVYESAPRTSPELLGGLYNNLALVLAALKRYQEAASYYEKALLVMAKVPGGELEQAITYINMANAVEAEQGAEEAEPLISQYMEQAYQLLDTSKAPRDGYYAFVCEKCAPAFSWYGYFMQAEELNHRAEEIYRTNREQ
ncbi:MAG: tetratricopeptide repeat protein [Parasporobacterium sp.]|nr:tetratricopeptide repeat protein [Parasporobacterium sp.]